MERGRGGNLEFSKEGEGVDQFDIARLGPIIFRVEFTLFGIEFDQLKESSFSHFPTEKKGDFCHAGVAYVSTLTFPCGQPLCLIPLISPHISRSPTFFKAQFEIYPMKHDSHPSSPP